VNRAVKNSTLTRGRPGVLRCKSEAAGESYNQDRHPRDALYGVLRTEDWEGSDGMHCPMPSVISLNQPRRFRFKHTQLPGLTGDIGALLSGKVRKLKLG
jgi:hypothetical protein